MRVIKLTRMQPVYDHDNKHDPYYKQEWSRTDVHIPTNQIQYFTPDTIQDRGNATAVTHVALDRIIFMVAESCSEISKQIELS